LLNETTGAEILKGVQTDRHPLIISQTREPPRHAGPRV